MPVGTNSSQTKEQFYQEGKQIGIVIQSLQQLTGCNYFFYYGTTIFNAVGMQNSFETSIVPWGY
ncbi:CPS_collapsed_G0017460.mRNA.1.CDS.1 [Saccharomyces cerevisiae]|nr:CPS_collapsed_G0017460.mRNA.1.CDS.1 [Saccharomyces cerevisiae]